MRVKKDVPERPIVDRTVEFAPVLPIEAGRLEITKKPGGPDTQPVRIEDSKDSIDFAKKRCCYEKHFDRMIVGGTVGNWIEGNIDE